MGPALAKSPPNLLVGDVVPMPTTPFWVITKSKRVDEPTVNSGTPAPREVVSTERRANGDVDPIPSEPDEVIRIASVKATFEFLV